MTRNTKIQGYTELDVLMFQAGAPTRFDSPYWTKREVDWSAVSASFVTPIATALRNLIALGTRCIGPSAQTA